MSLVVVTFFDNHFCKVDRVLKWVLTVRSLLQTALQTVQREPDVERGRGQRVFGVGVLGEFRKCCLQMSRLLILNENTSNNQTVNKMYLIYLLYDDAVQNFFICLHPRPSRLHAVLVTFATLAKRWLRGDKRTAGEKKRGAVAEWGAGRLCSVHLKHQRLIMDHKHRSLSHNIVKH